LRKLSGPAQSQVQPISHISYLPAYSLSRYVGLQVSVWGLTLKPTAMRLFWIDWKMPFGSGRYGRVTSDGYQKSMTSLSEAIPDEAIRSFAFWGSYVGRFSAL